MTDKKLNKYVAKRNFKKTPEPSGKISKLRQKNSFVIQKHDARNLHFDFRLRVGDALASWAVPKGPSINPKIKRLAIRVEDHPLDYANFEGTIPHGQYGGGTVMVWDRGSYDNLRAVKPGDGADMEKSLRQGLVEIYLHGKKLQGGYHLVKTKGFGGGNSWLLMKSQDEFADGRKNPVTSELKSAKSNKTMAEIAKTKKK